MRDDRFELDLETALRAYASEMPISDAALEAARGVASGPPALVPWWRPQFSPPLAAIRGAAIIATLLLAALLTLLVGGGRYGLFERPIDRLIGVSWGGDIVGVNPDDGARRVLVPCAFDRTACANVEHGMAWSPDGRSLAYGMTRFLSGEGAVPPDSELGLWILRVDDGTVRRVTGCAELGCDSPLSVAWAPDGSQIAVAAAGASSLKLVHPATGSIETVEVGMPLGVVTWSPEGRGLTFAATQGGRSRLYTASADGANVAALVDDPGAEVESPAWSPDGARLAYLTYTLTNEEPLGPGLLGHIWIREADASAASALFDATASCCRGSARWGGPVWSPDGRMLAFIAGHDYHLYTIDVDGGPPADLGDASGRTSPAWQPVP